MRKLNEQWIEDGRMYKAIRLVGTLFEKKDLGPVNKDECLKDERTGLFPTIGDVNWSEEHQWMATVHNEFATVVVFGRTRQEVINRWNHREAL